MEQLFSRADMHSVVQAETEKIRQHVESDSADYILKVGEEEYIGYLAEQYEMDVPIIDEGKIYVEEPRETKIDVTGHYAYGPPMRRGDRVMVPGTITTVVIPFDGNEHFFRIRPSAFSTAVQNAEIRENQLRFDFKQTTNSADAINTETERTLRYLNDNLKWLRSSAEQFNQSLPGVIRDLFNRRKQRLSDTQGMLEKIKYPVRRREGVESFSAPVKRKKIALQPPRVSPGPIQAEPFLEIAVYEDILNVMNNMSHVMELSPTAFEGIGEETLRFHFLVQLNGLFEGDATGETFNYTGKTDILIRVQGKNIFIAECKVWKGEQAFTETIDQLLGYLSWRDTKAAVVIFNRNVNFTDVLETIQAVTPTHTHFKRDGGKKDETTFRYVFGHPADSKRELTVTVMAFSIPVHRK